MFLGEIIIMFIAVVAIMLTIPMLVLCLARSISFRRRVQSLQPKLPICFQKPVEMATRDDPPKYEDVIMNPPDYAPREFYV